jgi:hypothetical protein
LLNYHVFLHRLNHLTLDWHVRQFWVLVFFADLFRFDLGGTSFLRVLLIVVNH